MQNPAPLVVVAPDKFKGSLTAREVAEQVVAGLRRYRPDVRVRTTPIADGGDGTLDAVTTCGFTRVQVQVSGPTGEPITAAFGRRGPVALVELAQASGLLRLPGGRPDPMSAGSRGTGDLIRAALDAGCTEVIIGVGGSACTDGGAGLLQALGVRLFDRGGHEIGSGGGPLAALDSIDLTGLDPRIASTHFQLACDVDNPLLGPQGAAAGYAAQKGATTTQIEELEMALSHWADQLTRALVPAHETVPAAPISAALASVPGAGAAGGTGFAALAVLGAQRRPGIELVLDLLDFDSLLAGAALVITGEGSLDQQSLHGKAPVGVAAAAARSGVPTVAVVGVTTLAPEQLSSAGLSAAYALTALEPDPATCRTDAARLLAELTATVLAPAHLAKPTP